MLPPADPSGLLARVPELEPLTSDRGIRRAIERGAPRAVYRALFWARWLGRLRADQKATADTLLGNRRLFLEPLTGAPIMQTINGIGTTIYGREEIGADGAYVTTLFFVFFFIPIFPIGAYLVADAGARRYTFFGKAPLGSFSYALGALWGVGATCAAIFGFGSALWASSHATLYVVDGLPMPVVATIGDQRIDVPAEGQASVVLGTGVQHVTITTIDGRTIQTGTIEARAGEDVLAWNVLGAAPLYLEQIVYGSSLYTPPPQADPELACGHDETHWGSVDYAFVEPPASIQMDSQYGTVSRSHAALAEGGFRLCVAFLATRDRTDEALALLTRVQGALPADDASSALGLASLASAVGGSLEQTLPMLDAARRAAPSDMDAQRAYQEAMIGLGRRDEALADYTAQASAAPESGDAAYLVARLGVPPTDVARFEDIVARFPDHAYATRALGYALYSAHQYDRALDVFSRPAATGPGSEMLAATRAESYLATGHPADGVQLLDEVTTSRPDLALAFSSTYAACARANGTSDPGLVLRRADFTDAPGLRLRALIAAGLPFDPDELTRLEAVDRDLTELFAAASSDPDRAIVLAGRLPVPAVRQLPPALLVLLLGEAARRDATSAATHALTVGAVVGPARAGVVREFVRAGTENGEIADLDPESRASVWLVRARATTDAAERARLLARIPEDDHLGSWPTRALAGWPPAEPTGT
jgi:tetratricopeptide (TPR) repeat protein